MCFFQPKWFYLSRYFKIKTAKNAKSRKSKSDNCIDLIVL